eukprot:scaffold10284_cov118-Isochrysis_galbana.AAC.10
MQVEAKAVSDAFTLSIAALRRGVRGVFNIQKSVNSAGSCGTGGARDGCTRVAAALSASRTRNARTTWRASRAGPMSAFSSNSDKPSDSSSRPKSSHGRLGLLNGICDVSRMTGSSGVAACRGFGALGDAS